MKSKQIAAGMLAFALAVQAVTVPAYADTGTKQVALELQVDADEGKEYLPRGKVDYVLTVRNLLGPSWIRVQLTCSTTDMDVNFSEENLNLISGWEKRGNYYYLTSKAEASSDYMIVDGFTMPDVSVSSAENPASIQISAEAEAVQWDSFRPDFTKENPWSGAEIKTSVSSSGGGSGHSSSGSGAVTSGTSTSMTLYASPENSGKVSGGTWELSDAEQHVWKYRDASGTYVKNGWLYLYNPYSSDPDPYGWFHFDSEGTMSYGWYQNTEKVWYYLHENSDGNLGKMETGWHEDSQDGKKYYLDPVSGIMLSGWQTIDGQEYYFTEYDASGRQTWLWNVIGNSGFGKWIYTLLGYRSYGSMYQNERTPDGSFVDESGVKQ